MSLGISAYITMAVSILVFVGVIIGLIFLIRYFIKYSSLMNKKKTQRQDELDRMKIDDL